MSSVNNMIEEYFVNFYDKSRVIESDPLSRNYIGFWNNEIAKNARELVEKKFTYEAAVERYRGILKELQ